MTTTTTATDAETAERDEHLVATRDRLAERLHHDHLLMPLRKYPPGRRLALDRIEADLNRLAAVDRRLADAGIPGTADRAAELHGARAWRDRWAAYADREATWRTT